jgi:DNA mismatch endonuclease (patch repair protein)
MQANPSRDTSPEMLLRSALHRAGLRFRKDTRPVPSLKCKADVVFPRARVCVFVDGCFWHGCPRHFRVPKTNGSWWKEKVEDNRARDKRKTRQLRSHGWTVLCYWEHEVKSESLDSIVRAVVRAVRQTNAKAEAKS